MATCKQCREFKKCEDDAFINGAKFDPDASAKYCTGFEPITNADRIRAMSDEELAKLLLDGCRGSKCEDQPQNEFGSVNCFDCRMKWLQQPAEVD